MECLRICNARIVNEGQITEGDLLVMGGRIDAIGTVPSKAKEQILEADGCYLLPGMIDHQVQFREPGMTLIADMASESCAAVAGGVTSFLDLPDPVSGTLKLQDVQEKYQLAQGRSLANFGFYLGAGRENIELLADLPTDQVCAVNLYMGGESGSKHLLDDAELLEQLFSKAPLLIAAHCEDMPTILENEESYRSIYGDAIPLEFHSVIRSEEACFLSSSQAVELARDHDVRLHLMQVSTERETALLADSEASEKKLTAAVSAHFLHFSNEDYANRGGMIKYNPAIKTAEDRASLIQALLDGRLDVVSSGHAPQSWDDKQQSSYFQLPSGMPMVQHALLVLLENYHDGIFSLELIAEKTSHNVARLFSIHERGFIREGYWADLVLIDTENGHMATHNTSLSRCGWTPFDGHRFRSTIRDTLVNGQLLWSGGSIQKTTPAGMALDFKLAN